MSDRFPDSPHFEDFPNHPEPHDTDPMPHYGDEDDLLLVPGREDQRLDDDIDPEVDGDPDLSDQEYPEQLPLTSLIPRPTVTDRPARSERPYEPVQLVDPEDTGRVVMLDKTGEEFTPNDIIAARRARRDGVIFPHQQDPTDSEKQAIDSVQHGGMLVGQRLGVPLGTRRPLLAHYRFFNTQEDFNTDVGAQLGDWVRDRPAVHDLNIGTMVVRTPDLGNLKTTLSHEDTHENATIWAQTEPGTGSIITAVNYGNLPGSERDLMGELASEIGAVEYMRLIAEPGELTHIRYVAASSLGHAAIAETARRTGEHPQAVQDKILTGYVDGRQARSAVHTLQRGIGVERTAALLGINPDLTIVEGLQTADALELPEARRLLEASDDTFAIFLWD